MALFNFTGCTGGNNIGNIIVSADTNFSSGWTGTTLVTLYDKTTLIPSVSGMCYIWDFTTTSTGNADFIVTNENQYAETEDCSRCGNNYSIRVSGCTGQGTWVIGSDTSPIAGTYEVGSAIHISNSSVLDGCFEVISDGYATQNHLLNGGETITENETGGCTQCEDDFPTPTPTPTLTPTPTMTPTQTPSASQVVLTDCKSISPSYVGQFIRENSSTAPSDTYLVTKLIPMLPPYPDPGNIDAPINYGSVRLDRTPLDGGDLNLSLIHI